MGINVFGYKVISFCVGAFLAGPAPEAQKAQVRELAAQVKQLWGTSAYMDSSKTIPQQFRINQSHACASLSILAPQFGQYFDLM